MSFRAKPMHMNLIPPGSRVFGLHFCCFQIFVVSSERRMIGIAEYVITLQGHPSSMIFMSIERAYATSY